MLFTRKYRDIVTQNYAFNCLHGNRFHYFIFINFQKFNNFVT